VRRWSRADVSMVVVLVFLAAWGVATLRGGPRKPEAPPGGQALQRAIELGEPLDAGPDLAQRKP
jgi:hypothetical protein